MTPPVRVYVGVGSNLDRERHIRAGLDALEGMFGELAVSPVYENEAVGFNGSPFLNLVVGLQTTLPLAALSRTLKGIEADNGRCAGSKRFSPCTLDLDILTYGDLDRSQDGVDIPRSEILVNAFVLRPLADLAGDERHPVDGRTYRELWRAYRSDQKLWPVAFRWRG
ncbi:2-amino-4-hydroxy-6-hydroxymethyldihydropteridinediphosphokinase [Marinobacter daqiaonensis]|uniref:2-amino-4-hydroxy-6-hydroxymethyldihydropteridine diphosphokinase n=1 Tax=Marinobacter daqiaonensis TaxID=650891 RepID=A0A1I6JW00_9GAMM|nr:2-amino-4-hydroxy-6-hydroxymethyldihydropteridine diphosphokinase [Marinobacter daqiaonensis]SFR83174.1 2-amino-4-hydroxy-6-hydroxymethyldihydropteridinediphosphokinase [Marinobacter daqiaonensis]